MTPTGTLVLYIGNPIVRNDQIGLVIGAHLRNLYGKAPGIEVREFTGSPLDLISLIEGYPTVILIDSVSLGSGDKGSVHLFDEAALVARRGDSYPHGMNIPEALALARRLGLDMPERLWLIGVEVGPIREFGDSPDAQLASRSQCIVREATAILERLLAL
jgi:hydrogenase maturation protease